MSPAANNRRRLIGGSAFGRWMVVSGSTGVRTYVYDLGDRLEIEERDHWNIGWRRIPLRDVVLMTRREVRQIWAAVACLAIAALFGFVSFAAATGNDPMVGVIVFLILGAPFLALGLFRLLPQTELQVQTRRVTARMRYGFFARKRATDLWTDLSARIRAAQKVQAGPKPAAVVPGEIPLGDADVAATTPGLADPGPFQA